MNTKTVLAACMLGVFTLWTHAASNDDTIPQYPGWQLVWHDEFDTDGRPNLDNWDYERGFVRNRELQWYQPENAFCENGVLVIEGRRERKPNPTYNPESRNWTQGREFIDYTAASLRTRGKHAWQYGRFEIRAKIVAADGLWPAIWMLGVERRWPQCGEIDIMEYYRGMILANLCWWNQKDQWGTHWEETKTPVKELIEKTNNPRWAEEFHVWRMDWDKNAITLYVDDILLNKVDINAATYDDGFNPFRQRHYMLLNLAIGAHRAATHQLPNFLRATLSITCGSISKNDINKTAARKSG